MSTGLLTANWDLGPWLCKGQSNAMPSPSECRVSDVKSIGSEIFAKTRNSNSPVFNLNKFSQSGIVSLSVNGPSAQPGHKKVDRSLSDPVDKTGPIPKNINSSRYKTELCRPFVENGSCKYGDKCQFAHGEQELRALPRHPKYKTELCRTFHTSGICPYGIRCHFVHNENEARVKLQRSKVPSDLSLGSSGESPSPTPSLSDSPDPQSSLGNIFFGEDYFSSFYSNSLELRLPIFSQLSG